MATWVSREMAPGCCGGKGAMVMENGKKEKSTQKMHKVNISTKSLAGKIIGVDFQDSLQPEGLKDWILKVQQA